MIGREILNEYLVSIRKTPFYFKDLLIGYPFSVEQLYNNTGKILMPREQGIYHLFKDDELVYIGMSKNICNRLLDHLRDEKKDFNYCLWFVIKEKTVDEIFQIEKRMIKYWKPKYNQTHNYDQITTH
jgi:excinuclease UvrABC nuclease subunit